MTISSRFSGRAMAAALTVSLVLAACGDDDTATDATDDTTETSEAAATVDDYCERSREINEQESFPTTEQVDALAEAAPEAIADAADAIATAFREEGLDAFSRPEIAEHLETLEAFDAEACGIEDEDMEVDPSEFAAGAEEYCTKTIELNNQNSFPTDEQLDDLAAAAPDEIAPQVQEVADLFKELGPEQAFESEEFLTAIGALEDWEAENCGITYDDEAEAGDTEDEGSTADPDGDY